MQRSERLAPALLVALVACVYAGSLRHGFVYDDFEVIVEQEAPRSVGALLQMFVQPHGLPSSQLPYYRAVTRVTLLGQKAIHGDVPALFHAMNVAIAAAAALVAFSLLRLPAFALPWPLAWLAAALFALHPVASSVVYPAASGRETLLPGLFWLLSTFAFLRGHRGRATAAFAVALLGKEQAIALPAVFVLADVLRLSPSPPGRSLRRWIVGYAPVAAVLAGYLALRSAILPSAGDIDLLAVLEAHKTGPVLSLAYTLQVLFTPFLDLAYEPAFAAWWAPKRLALAVALALALILGVARQGADARRRLVFWLGFAAASVALTSNLLPQETLFDERFVFLASLSVTALLAQLAAPLWSEPRWRTPLVASGATLVLAAALASLHRGESFVDAVAFGRQWVQTSPERANAQFTLGTALARANRTEEARAPLEEAVRLAPGYASARYNLAVVLADLGQLDRAASHLELLSKLTPQDAEPHRMLAVLYQRLGRAEQAEAEARKARDLGDASR